MTPLEINPGRLVFGLSRIGYTTTSALCDIIDNSIRAKADKIYVQIIKARPEMPDARRNNVSEYVIIDNGNGMNRAGILDALKLGANDMEYEPQSLSKFGLGVSAPKNRTV